ncbi:MAG: hypothetical protein ACRETP_15315, partial [Steroidobacteraceae bacterium]
VVISRGRFGRAVGQRPFRGEPRYETSAIGHRVRGKARACCHGEELPDAEQHLDGGARLLTQTGEFLFSQQSFHANLGQHCERRGASRIIEETRNIPIAPLHEPKQFEVAFMMTLATVARDSLDFTEHALAEALESERMHTSQYLPVSFSERAICVHHLGSK